MIVLILIVIAFIWLGYETDWMRVRLLVGVQSSEHRKSWLDLKPYTTKKTDPFWLRWPEIMEPMCGLKWLEETMHIIPEYKIELISPGCKQTIRSESVPALRDAFRVYRNPYIKIKLA